MGGRVPLFEHRPPSSLYGIRPSEGEVVGGRTLEETVWMLKGDPGADRPSDRPDTRKRPTGRV